MNFDKAFEYASGQLKAEELNNNSDEVTDQASEQTTASTAGGNESIEEKEEKPKRLGFGMFQLFAVLLITLGKTSGSYIIFPLSYLELMPQFKCEYE